MGKKIDYYQTIRQYGLRVRCSKPNGLPTVIIWTGRHCVSVAERIEIHPGEAMSSEMAACLSAALLIAAEVLDKEFRPAFDDQGNLVCPKRAKEVSRGH
jgi:hypothetical protein